MSLTIIPYMRLSACSGVLPSLYRIFEKVVRAMSDRTFREAAESYLRLGGEGKYLGRILTRIGDRPVREITPAEVRDVALDLYPDHKASTRNRHAITPIRAVMLHAHENGWCSPIRIRSFRVEKSTLHQPVNGEWLSRFIRQSDRDKLFHLSALVLFMHDTAARVSEAVELTGEHVDLRRRIATLVRTKTDRMATAYLTDELVFRLHQLDLMRGEPVFRYRSRFSVNDRIRAVCRRAGIEYHPSHSVGRYSFATRALSLGVGVKAAMDAGRWKSSKIFLETYAHAENAGRLVAEKLNGQRYATL